VRPVAPDLGVGGARLCRARDDCWLGKRPSPPGHAKSRPTNSDGHGVASRKHMNARIKKLIFGTSAPLQIGADRSGRDRRTWANENLYFGGDTDTFGIQCVIEWLDPKAVARHEKLLPGVIVDDEGEHSL